jgi:hypothetical protein
MKVVLLCPQLEDMTCCADLKNMLSLWEHGAEENKVKRGWTKLFKEIHNLYFLPSTVRMMK